MIRIADKAHLPPGEAAIGCWEDECPNIITPGELYAQEMHGVTASGDVTEVAKCLGCSSYKDWTIAQHP